MIDRYFQAAFLATLLLASLGAAATWSVITAVRAYRARLAFLPNVGGHDDA